MGVLVGQYFMVCIVGYMLSTDYFDKLINGQWHVPQCYRVGNEDGLSTPTRIVMDGLGQYQL